MRGSSGEVSFEELESLTHVPFDDALDALGDVRRHRVLFALLDQRGTVSVDSLLDTVADGSADEHGTEMNHVHLPKLATYGFVDWDRESHDVASETALDDIERCSHCWPTTNPSYPTPGCNATAKGLDPDRDTDGSGRSGRV